MAVLITGTGGFLGARLAARIKARAFGRAQGGLNDKDATARAVSGIDVIIHAAAAKKGPVHEVNAEGTRNLIEACKARHFIFVSSILAAYDKTTAYGKSKKDAEEIVRKSGIPYTIFRVSLMYGKGDTGTIAKLSKLKLPIIPVINAKFQPVHVDDVADAIAKAAKKSAKNKTYYLAGPTITLREAMAVCGNKVFITIPLWLLKIAFLLPMPFTKAQLEFLTSGKSFDYSSASRDFGFKPRKFGGTDE